MKALVYAVATLISGYCLLQLKPYTDFALVSFVEWVNPYMEEFWRMVYVMSTDTPVLYFTFFAFFGFLFMTALILCLTEILDIAKCVYDWVQEK